MTIEEAREAVKGIDEMKGDPEAAHSAEDGLYRNFIQFVASQGGPLGEVATEVLKAACLDYTRWYA
jgi:hypothetical protein